MKTDMPDDPPANPIMRLVSNPYFLVVMTMVFWSGNAVMGRFIRDDIPPITLAFWRWTLAVLVLMIVVRPPLRRDWTELRRSWKVVVLLGTLGTSLFNTMQYVALQATTATNVAIIQTIMPLMIVAVSFVLFRERINARQAAGIVLSLIGVGVVITLADLAMIWTLTFNSGDVVMVLAVMIVSLFAVLLRWQPKVNEWSFLTATFVVGAVQLFPLYLWEAQVVGPMTWNLKTSAAIGYIVVGPAILAYYCFARGIARIGANSVAPFFNLLPLFTVLLAVPFLGEQITLIHVVGMVFIVTGIRLATRAARGKGLTG